MSAARRRCDERGSASVEFITLGVALFVPLIYLVLMLARLEAGSYAVTAAAQSAGRAYATAEDSSSGRARAQVAARLAFADQGFDGTGTITAACDGTPCLRPDGRIRVTATVRVPMPLIPAFVRSVVPLEIPVTSRYETVVEHYRERE